MPRDALIQIRQGTAANWASVNPILAAGEPGFETDTGKHKIGDGVTAWAGLSYFIDEAALSATYLSYTAPPYGTAITTQADAEPIKVTDPGGVYGTGVVFGNSAGFGMGSVGGPVSQFAPWGIYQRYGDFMNGTATDIVGTTQGGFVVTNYYGPTTEDAAESFSSVALLKAMLPNGDPVTPFTQTRPVTGFEGDVQVEGANNVSGAGAYVAGVGARVTQTGPGQIQNAYAFYIGQSVKGAGGTINTWYGLYQAAAGPGIINYGAYLKDLMQSETGFSAADPAHTGSVHVRKLGYTDSLTSQVLVEMPNVTGGEPDATGLRVVQGSGGQKELLSLWLSGGTVPAVSVNRIGYMFVRGGALVMQNASGATSLSSLTTNGGVRPGSPAGMGATIYSGSGVPNVVGSAAGDLYIRTDTPATSNQRLYMATAANAWTGIL